MTLSQIFLLFSFFFCTSTAQATTAFPTLELQRFWELHHWRTVCLADECELQDCSGSAQYPAQDCKTVSVCQVKELELMGKDFETALLYCPNDEIRQLRDSLALSAQLNQRRGSNFSFDKNQLPQDGLSFDRRSFRRVSIDRVDRGTQRVSCGTGAGNGNFSNVSGSTTVEVSLGSKGELVASEEVPYISCKVPLDVKLDKNQESFE